MANDQAVFSTDIAAWQKRRKARPALLVNTIWLNLSMRVCFSPFYIQSFQVYLSPLLELWLPNFVLNSSSIGHFVRTHKLQFRKHSRTCNEYSLYIVHGTGFYYKRMPPHQKETESLWWWWWSSSCSYSCSCCSSCSCCCSSFSCCCCCSSSYVLFVLLVVLLVRVLVLLVLVLLVILVLVLVVKELLNALYKYT